MLLIAGCWQFGWKEFSPPERSFKVLLPGSPTTENYLENTPVGEITSRTYITDKKGISYVVGYVEYPDTFIKMTTPDLLLYKVRNSLTEMFEGKLISEKSVPFEEYPGTQVSIKPARGNKIFHCRIFFVGRRVYQFGTLSSEGKSSSRMVRKFMNSFKLTEE
jgi:hypothetical protein